MRVNIKKIAIWTCAAALICGFKWMDYEAQKHIAYAEQFVNPIGQADRNGNAPTAMEANHTNETNKDNSIILSDKLASRGETESEKKAKRIDKFLNNGLRNKGRVIVGAGEVYNVNPFLMAAIMIHETGNGTSKVFKQKNNVGGMMNNGMTFRSFNTVDESIFAMAKLLSEYYIAEGRMDIESIGNKFCPPNAANDRVTKLNQYWVPNVSAKYAEITEGMK